MYSIGKSWHYFTYDTRPRTDGKYHIGEGRPFGWNLGKGYKTAEAAKRAALKLAEKYGLLED